MEPSGLRHLTAAIVPSAEKAKQEGFTLGPVYHGTDKTFDEFAPGHARTAADFYFTPNRETAEVYGKNVRECYLKVHHVFNMADLEDLGPEHYRVFQEMFDDIGADWGFDDLDDFVETVTGGKMYERFASSRFQDEVLQEINAKGYDCVHMVDAGFGGHFDESYVIFDMALVAVVQEVGQPVNTSVSSAALQMTKTQPKFSQIKTAKPIEVPPSLSQGIIDDLAAQLDHALAARAHLSDGLVVAVNAAPAIQRCLAADVGSSFPVVLHVVHGDHLAHAGRFDPNSMAISLTVEVMDVADAQKRADDIYNLIFTDVVHELTHLIEFLAQGPAAWASDPTMNEVKAYGSELCEVLIHHRLRDLYYSIDEFLGESYVQEIVDKFHGDYRRRLLRDLGYVDARLPRPKERSSSMRTAEAGRPSRGMDGFRGADRPTEAPILTRIASKPVPPEALAIVQEMMSVLPPGTPLPELSVVNTPRSAWLGRCHYIWGNPTSSIQLQQGILADEPTLRKIIAHELCHHGEFMDRKVLAQAKGWDLPTWRRIEELRHVSHGREFEAWAEKFNAVYGVGYVTRTSDESQVVSDTTADVHVLLRKMEGREQIRWSAAMRPSAKQREFITDSLTRPGCKYVLSHDPDIAQGTSIGKGWSWTPEEKLNIKLRKLWDEGQAVRVAKKTAKLLTPKIAVPLKADVPALIDEFLSFLDPEHKCSVPTYQIVNRVNVTWLGQCKPMSWNVNDQHIVDAYTSKIFLQKGAFATVEHGRKVTAHEVAHHVADSQCVLGFSPEEASKNLKARGDHGKAWQAEAAKLNAHYGADFCTVTSDAATNEYERKEVYVFIVTFAGTAIWCWATSVTPDMIKRLTTFSQDEGNTCFIGKTTNRFLVVPDAKAYHWATVMRQDQWAAIREIVKGQENLFTDYANGAKQPTPGPVKRWTLIMANPFRGTEKPRWINAWAIARRLTPDEERLLGQLNDLERQNRYTPMVGQKDLFEVLPKFTMHDVVYNAGRASNDVQAPECQARLREQWSETAPPASKASKQQGPALTFNDTCRGYHHGQYDNTLYAYAGSTRVGRVDYSNYGGEISIQMLEVAPEFRRAGYGTALLRELQRQNPGTEIQLGMQTDEGAKLIDSLKFNEVPTDYADKLNELNQLQKRAEEVQAQWDALFEKENPTPEERKAMAEQTADGQDVLDRIWELEEELRGKSPTKRLIAKFLRLRCASAPVDLPPRLIAELTDYVVLGIEQASAGASWSLRALRWEQDVTDIVRAEWIPSAPGFTRLRLGLTLGPAAVMGSVTSRAVYNIPNRSLEVAWWGLTQDSIVEIPEEIRSRTYTMISHELVHVLQHTLRGHDYSGANQCPYSHDEAKAYSLPLCDDFVTAMENDHELTPEAFLAKSPEWLRIRPHFDRYGQNRIKQDIAWTYNEFHLWMALHSTTSDSGGVVGDGGDRTVGGDARTGASTQTAGAESCLNPSLLTLYRGESVHNRGGRYWTPDREWARQFTQSNQDSEILRGVIDSTKIYRPDPLPKAVSETEFDDAVAEAKRRGYAGVWFDEGPGEPDSVYMVNRFALKRASGIWPAGWIDPSGTYHVCDDYDEFAALERMKRDRLSPRQIAEIEARAHVAARQQVPEEGEQVTPWDLMHIAVAQDDELSDAIINYVQENFEWAEHPDLRDRLIKIIRKGPATTKPLWRAEEDSQRGPEDGERRFRSWSAAKDTALYLGHHMCSKNFVLRATDGAAVKALSIEDFAYWRGRVLGKPIGNSQQAEYLVLDASLPKRALKTNVRWAAKLLQPKTAAFTGLIYLDSDGVLMDYMRGAAEAGVPPDEFLSIPGAFRNLKPMPGATEAVAKLQRIAPGRVRVLSTPARDRFKESCIEKRENLAEHFPSIPPEHIHLVLDKGAAGKPGDILVDDNPTWNGADRFPGTVTHFTGPHCWEKVFRAVGQ